MSDTLIILLPLLALILAGVSIAGLWYWWSSGQEEEAAEDTKSEPAGGMRQQTSQPPQPAEPTVGDVVGKVTTTAQSWLANIAKAAGAPATGSTPSLYGSTSMPPTVDGEMVEVVRVLRDLADGSLVVEIGGRRYRDLAEISDPQIRRRFMGNAQALAQFVQVTASPSSDTGSWSDTVPEATEQSPLASRPAEPPVSAPSITGVGTASGASQEQLGGPKTMADEIEELIQLHLDATPSLASRSIHIRQGAGGGIRVEVDGRYFDSVASVTDPEITAFLQSVIREWEARQ